MSKKIMINCNEATTICNKNQYCKASFMDKFRLGIHNFLCKNCKSYSIQNTIMTKIFRMHLCSNNQKLTETEKEQIKENIKVEKQIN